MAPRIQILVHEADSPANGPSYFAWGLRDVWKQMGFDVEIARGPGVALSADLVLPHIDVTVVPEPYRALLDAHPNVVNRGLYDISKRAVSRQLVRPDDPYDGPVIVKTDRNCGGVPDRRVERSEQGAWGRVRRRFKKRSLVRSKSYKIFERLAEVPTDVFADPSLVVEQFLPEREDDVYFVRWYIFIGDRYRSMRVGAKHPLVKLAEVDRKEYGVPVPPEVVAFRETWGMDFGKIDFVMHDGRPVILDVNSTPADLPPAERLAACRPYGPGVLPLLEERRSFDHVDVDR